MIPEQFVEKWAASELKERSAAQEHFVDLCHLLDEATPADADPKGEFYCFERGATKTTGGEGWADVWKRHHFGWEYKGKRKDLDAAFAQLQQYAIALENPPLLVVSDMERFRIHTNWTNTISEVHEFELEGLLDRENRQLLKWVLSDPRPLKPKLTRDALTEQAASKFAGLAQRLRERDHEPHDVAHFINRLVFCMFAEDVHLLPNDLFTRMLEVALKDPSQFEDLASQLFGAMQSGGIAGFDRVDWFNGGLFDSDQALPLIRDEIAGVLDAARMNWADIDPSIFGTLFERGLDPDKRSQLGAHYTDREKIMMIVEPVVLRPLEQEWRETRSAIQKFMAKAETAKSGAKTKAVNRANALRREFLDSLRSFRVLDPACGSGNFLYLALLTLKDLEHRVNLDCEALGLEREFPQVGPEVVKGIEINPYAAELARVTVWIGEIQWMKRNGFNVSRNPILKPLDTIECRDALLNEDGTEAEWPAAHAIVGNPPFLGGKKIIGELGADYAERLRRAYAGRLPRFTDLVTYWFEISRDLIVSGTANRAGLVATNSIRGGSNLACLSRVQKDARLFEVWSDEPWTVEGAAVRVCIVCFGSKYEETTLCLNGLSVSHINADLTSTTYDLTNAGQLVENTGVCFEGGQKHGPFELDGDTARVWLQAPTNPNGRPNADVVRPLRNASDIVRKSSDTWVIDFGDDMTAQEAAFYELPFGHVSKVVKPVRLRSTLRSQRDLWWRHHRTRPELRAKIRQLDRFIVTPVVSKHRIFVWFSNAVWPSNLLDAIARNDDTTFGILHSRFHELWTLRMCTWLGVGNDPRYTPTTTFETFPFPEGLTPDIPASDYADDPRAIAIAEAARRLNEFRENWLNPEDLVRREPEVVPGYPDRILPVDDKAAAILKKRTLTNLYNEPPAWLDHAHRELDEAVASAYGWPADLNDDEILARLFELNQERAA